MMKKSQILAAIALAMALGVVAPVVSVYADEPTYTQEQNAERAQKAENDAKKSFGEVILKGENDKVVNGYEAYKAADGAIAAANGVVTAAKGITADQAGAAKDLLDGIKAAETAGTGITLTKDTQDKVAALKAKPADYDFDAVSKIAQTVLAEYNAEASKESDKKDAAKNAAAEITKGIENAQKTLDQAVATAAEVVDKAATETDPAVINVITPITAKIKSLTNETVATPKTVAELNAAIAKLEKALPQMGRFRAVDIAINNLKKGIEDKLTSDQITSLIKALEAAVAGTGNGTTVPGGSDVNAPATGIAGTAEGTATTVSIVAGLATALTALGAGVVAYRSARRK